MPMSIPPGLTQEHVRRTLADLDGGIDHPFGQPTGYELVHDGKRYAPKAVIGLACRFSIGRILLPEEFSGGEAPGQATFVLRKLGFTVLRRRDGDSVQDTDAARDWNEQEVRLIVADYFAMLEAELNRENYKKSDHRRALIPLLAGRSDGSVEFKHQNVSSVLVEMGLPYIDGYKPRGNHQSLLAIEVESFLDQRPGFLQKLAAAPVLNPSHVPEPSSPDLNKIIVDPPEQKIAAPSRIEDKPWLSRRGQRIDFAEKDAANRTLGRLAEEFVYALERHRLKEAGRDDLALKVEWGGTDRHCNAIRFPVGGSCNHR